MSRTNLIFEIALHKQSVSRSQDSARYQGLTGRAQTTPLRVGVEGKTKGDVRSIATADAHATAGT